MASGKTSVAAIKKLPAVSGANVKCLPIKAAAKYLGVTESTVKTWIRVRKLQAVEKRLVVKCVVGGPGKPGGMRVTCSECGQEFPAEKADLAIFCVRLNSLRTAFDATCVICGKTFKAKHPRRAMFCCANHRYKGFMLRQPNGRPRYKAAPRK